MTTAIRRLSTQLSDFPPTMLIIGVIAALPGYVFLLSFPLTGISLVLRLPNLFPLANSPLAWSLLVGSLITIILCATISYFIIRLPFRQPSGFPLDHKMAPALFELVEELEETFGQSKVDRIVLHNGFGVRLIQTPKFGLPFVTTNTLVIGLPQLLTLSPDQFKSLLARRIGQACGKYNYLSGWLYNLRGIWAQYQDNYARHKSMQARLLCAFFRFYVPIYENLSLVAVRHDELKADRYACDFVHYQDLSEAISQEIVIRQFLRRKFWPGIEKLARSKKGTHYLPFSHMTKIVEDGLTQKDADTWLMAALNQESNRADPMPSLRTRLDNIWNDKVRHFIPLQGAAAVEYLESHTLVQVIKRFDALWLKHSKRERFQ